MKGGPARELWIRGGTLVAMDERRSVRQADVLVRDGVIAWIGRRPPRRRPGVERERLDARGAAVLPGFVQCHVHLCQVLFRGMADDLPLLRWLRERIWPLEAAHDRASLAVSAELGLAELLRGGTTSVLDMGTVHHHDAVFAAMARAGIRGASGKAMMDRASPRGLKERTRDSLAESERLAARWHGAAGGRLSYAWAPRFILSCSERLLRGVVERARDGDQRIHTHVAEHADERRAVRKALGQDDLSAFARMGLRGPDVIMAHGVQLRAAELNRLARDGTRLVHCPSANLKLASGIADVPGMLARGVVVGVGADGAPCNNRLDALGEARHAALLAKWRRRDAAALSAWQALSLITIEGARCLGLQDEIGSLEVGKRADLTVVSLDGPHQAPVSDVVSALVYASSADDVRHVVVDGEVRVRERELCGVDVGRLLARAQRQAKRVRARAGV